ncbi:MAG TPA: type II toxin-antitoxin system VapC family toxin [Acetobacteraceae bacterium]|nr:type II toxin-antitoxin system VapC family toxin [Acetobacteraceae bacterium]
MTPIKVVDASAVVALLLNEPEARTIAESLDGATLIAPALLPFEVANACLSKSRRHPELGDFIWTAFGRRDLLRIETAEVDHADVLILAARTGLTAYDASYLWLARATRTALVTLDRKLARVAAGGTTREPRDTSMCYIGSPFR